MYVIVIVNHCPSSYIRRIVSNLISFYLSKTADWQSKARVIINLSIRERFRIFTCGAVYDVNLGDQEFQINDTNSESAALKGACILLEQGKLNKFSEQPHKQITVKGADSTVVYEASKELTEQHQKEYPQI